MDGSFLKEKRKNWLKATHQTPVDYEEVLEFIERLNTAYKNNKIDQFVTSEKDMHLSDCVTKLVARELTAIEEMNGED